MSGEWKVRYVQQIIATGNQLQDLRFPALYLCHCTVSVRCDPHPWRFAGWILCDDLKRGPRLHPGDCNRPAPAGPSGLDHGPEFFQGIDRLRQCGQHVRV